MITLDGSRGEGGGQMLRTALVWSLMTRTPFRMTNIRAGRKDPGLKPQHVTILRSLRHFGEVSFKGAAPGSSVVEFHPAAVKGAEATIDIGTAGSITLLLQTLVPVALLAEGASRLRLVGGTDVSWSPTLDYLRNVVLPIVGERSQVLRLTEGDRRGFYPKGGGEAILEAGGWRRDAAPIRATERGKLVSVEIHSVASQSLEERRVAERQTEGAREILRPHAFAPKVEARYSRTFSPGSVVTCVATFEDGSRLGGSRLGERGKPAEEVGREAAQALVREIESGACVDAFAADQLIIWMALSGGEFRTSELSSHTSTNMEVTEAFLGKIFEVKELKILCRGRS
jgi:RNA 3'-terminal phosphate cyclase (GTP)